MIPLILLFLRLVEPAPMHMQPMPAHMQAYPMAHMPNLRQMLELQSMQMNPFAIMDQPRPLVILLPNDDPKSNELNQNEKTKADFGNVDEDLDSVVIDASEEMPQRALFLLPNGRLSLGGFISSIPWLPIEINVPDTISWAYNGIASGISGIISIIGQRFPFQRPTVNQDPSLKSILNSLELRNNVAKPVMFMPTQRLNLPIQV